MSIGLDIPKIQALLKEQAANDAVLADIADQYEALKETARSMGMGLTGAEWNLIVRAFEARTNRKELRKEEVRLNTEIKALTGGPKLPKLAVWLLLTKLQTVADLLEPEDAAYDAFHDIFDWAEQIYEGRIAYHTFREAIEADIVLD